MGVLRTTAGQVAVNAALPPALRDYGRVLDKKGAAELFRRLAESHPDLYRDVSQRLSDLGRSVASRSAHYAPTLDDLTAAPSALKARGEIAAEVSALLARDGGDPRGRAAAILKAVGRHQESLPKAVLAESLAEENPLAYQVASGARGSAANLAALRAGDLLYTDRHDRLIPIPIVHSYSEGQHPAEYLAGAFGARKGIVATKRDVARGGYLGKQLAQADHRLVVTAHDADDEGGPDAAGRPVRGLPVDADDPDNEGALLAAPAAGYPRNTVLTPAVLAEVRRAGVPRLLVRSPAAAASAPDGGLYARDVGVREFGRLPRPGEAVGMTAAGALAEPIAQGGLNSKHAAGVAGQGPRLSGFQRIERMLAVPQNFRGGVHAQLDGRVAAVTPAAAGGWNVEVGGRKHYVPAESRPLVNPGDEVEAGDLVGEGEPNPAELAKHKGHGEARRYYATAFRDLLRSTGGKADRRNVELAARGLINHVRLTDEVGPHAPGDVVPYDLVEQSYEPRPDAKRLPPRRAAGKYLEEPVLHYTVGTKVRPSVLKELEHWGVKEVHAHDDPPPFEPLMVRSADNLRHDPDPVTRMYGSNLRRGFLEAVHRGETSDEAGTSFVPGLARSKGFGSYGALKPEKAAQAAKAAAGGVDAHGQPLSGGPTATPAAVPHGGGASTTAPLPAPQLRLPQAHAGLLNAAAAPDAARSWLNMENDPVGGIARFGTLFAPHETAALTGGPGARTGLGEGAPDYAAENAHAGGWQVDKSIADNARAKEEAAARGETAGDPGGPGGAGGGSTWGRDAFDVGLGPALGGVWGAGKALWQGAGMAGAAGSGLKAFAGGLNPTGALLGNAGVDAALRSGDALANARAGFDAPAVRQPGGPGGSAFRAALPQAGRGIFDTLNFVERATRPEAQGGGLYDPGKYQQELRNFEDYEHRSLLGRAVNAANPSTLSAAGHATADAVDRGMAEGQRGLDLDVKARGARTINDAYRQVAGKHERWLAAVRQGADPNAPFLDPATGTYYTRGEYDDYAEWARRGGAARNDPAKGRGVGDRVFQKLLPW